MRLANAPAILCLLPFSVVCGFAANQAVQVSPAAQSGPEGSIMQQLRGLRRLADSDRAVTTKKLALQIRQLHAGQTKVQLANGLASLATEGDFGKSTLQEVTTTLALAAKESPEGWQNGEPAAQYQELAQLAKYEHMKVELDSSEYKAAQVQLDAIDSARKKVDFTLTDIKGTSWTLSSLHGKVVLVNFWATWCPPCKKEMPDLQTLYNRFKDQGFVILSISDETADKVDPFIAAHQYTWPVLLDPGRKVNDLYRVQGIPKSFLYNRKGQLIGQTIDMRTQAQFLELLATAGLK